MCYLLVSRRGKGLKHEYILSNSGQQEKVLVDIMKTFGFAIRINHMYHLASREKSHQHKNNSRFLKEII